MVNLPRVRSHQILYVWSQAYKQMLLKNLFPLKIYFNSEMLDEWVYPVWLDPDILYTYMS